MTDPAPPPTTARWIPTDQGIELYAATPTAYPPDATVVVGMELFGVTPWIQSACHRLARAGYAAIAPDYYGRLSPRVQLPYDDKGVQQGFELLSRLDTEEVAADTAAALEAGDRLGAGPGRAFAGFSLGGHLGILAATRIRLDTVISCYGGWTLDGGIALADPEPPLSAESAATLASTGTTLIGFVGERDSLISADEWHRLGARLHQAGVLHDLIAYPDAEHGFLCEDRADTYDAEAADDVWRRILATLYRLTKTPRTPPG